MHTPPLYFRSFKQQGEVFEKGVVCLIYHKVARPSLATVLPGLYVDPKHLGVQLDELKAAGLNCLPFAQAHAQGTGGQRGFCLTFDDGFRNVFDNALPMLRERGLSSIQFIVADRIGATDTWDETLGERPQPLMDDGQIREWLASGQEIGSHSLAHPLLTSLPPQQAQTEIRDSKAKLEDRFGVAIRFFCYPYGGYNARLRDMVMEAGYEAACTTRYGAIVPGDQAFELPRVLALNPRRAAHAMIGQLRRVLK